MKLLLLIFLQFVLYSADPAKADRIEVCANCVHRSIGEGVAAAKEGDVVVVKQGTYKEHDIIIDKQISIEGEGSPVMDIDFKGAGFTVRKSNVRISGLSFRNVDVNYLSELSAVRIEYADYCLIENNSFENTFFAVYLAGVNHSRVKGNKITGHARSESSSGNGIHLWKCSGLIVEDNSIFGHRDGIYLEFVYGSSVDRNTSSLNLRYGLHYMFSDSNSYSGNTFEKNGAGVAVMYSKNFRMTRNIFRDNWGDAAYGLLLKELYDGLIQGNVFFRNTSAIHIEGSNRIEVDGNDFIENGWAVNALGNSYDNRFTENNFISNTFDISSNSSQNNNFYSGNYWDKYEGYDINRDGTGDIPYRPVSLFSMIIEKSPESIIMLRSIMVDLLDAVERVIPSLIPETLIDESPRFNKISNG